MAIGSGALFGNTSSRNQSKNLVEFKAGKMELKGNMVHPDKRKGLVFVHQTDDSLMHFCWKDRTSGTVVDDLIIFPDDVEYKRVSQCTTGRVYVLKFKSTHRKLFFWMQEPKTEKDEEHCKKVNEYLNNPPVLGSSRSGGSTPGGLPSELSNLGDSDVQTLLNNMSQQQLMQLFGNVGGMGTMNSLSSLLGSRPTSVSSSQSTRASAASPRQETPPTTTPTTTAPSAATTAATTATTTSANTTAAAATTTTTTTTTTTATTAAAAASSGQIQLSDLQNILSGISVPASGDDQARTAVDLSSALNADALQPILSNTEFIERLQALLPQVESGGTTEMDQVRGTLQSPQFQQAMSTFSAALQSGQLGPLMQQFGLGDDAVSAAAQGDIEAFVRALQLSQGKQNPEGDAKKPAEKKDDDEDMSLD